MEAYRKRLKRAMIVEIIVMAVMFLLTALCYVSYTKLPESAHTQSFFAGFQSGVFFAWAAIMLYGIITAAKALRNQEYLRKQYIKEYDERRREVHTQAQSKAYRISLMTLMAAAVLAGFFSFSIFLTLLIVLAAEALCGAVMKVVIDHTI